MSIYKKSKIIAFLTVGLLSMSFIPSSYQVDCLDDCCDCKNHDHEESTEQNNTVTINLPKKYTFGGKYNSNESNYGTVNVVANYQPVGCLTDTIWITSDESKVSITPSSDYSNNATLTCLSKFNDEVTITAKSRFYSNINYTCKATYTEKLVITPLVENVSLTSTTTYLCPKSYSTYYSSKALNELFSLTGSSEGLTYTVGNANITVSNDKVQACCLSNASSTITATSVEDASKSVSIPVTVAYSAVGNSSSHTYIYKSCTTYYEDGVSTTTYGAWSSYSYGDWIIDTASTCTSAGSKHRVVTRSRTVTTVTKKLRYDNDYSTCKYCGLGKYSGYYNYSAGNQETTSTSTETDTTTETETISTRLHDYSIKTSTSKTFWHCPTCNNNNSAVSYGSSATCSRCHEVWTITPSMAVTLYLYKCSMCGDVSNYYK